VGKLLPFRRRRWTRARDYRAPRDKTYFWPEDDPRHWTVRGVARETRQWLRRLRPFILGGIALSVWPALDPALVGPPEFLGTEPETVSAIFTPCGPGRGEACVVDGDTFKLGKRKIRIIGIDAPEIHPARCREEAELGARATVKLQALLSDGPFVMTGWAHNRRDRYGHELMALTRTHPDGTIQSVAAEMRSSGLARYYSGGLRGGWC
jgi:endonuclease YncB( thermonuclease family)